LFGILDEPCFSGDHADLFDQTFTLNTPDTESLFCALTDNAKALAQQQDNAPANHEIDHDYTPHRPPTRNSLSGLSDSGISSDSNGQLSPQYSPQQVSDSAGYTSDNGQISPGISSSQNSPLGGGMEDMDINQCLFDGDLMDILTTDQKISIDLGEYLSYCNYHYITLL
jgi:hypothetical protein